jgi:C1A family cysteine protease
MINVKELNQQLVKEKATWRAVESPITKLSTEQYKRMLGWERDKNISKKKPTSARLKKKLQAFPGASFDKVVDWRNRNGKNFVSPVKDQGGCGACVSFAVAGLVESMALIEKGVVLDLSESDLAFCGSHPSDCGAWGEGGALNDMKSRGTVSDNRFPYLTAFPNNDTWNSAPNCMITSNHDQYSVKIAGFENIFDVSDRKSYLTHVGPVVAGITAYDDFSPAPGGIYSPSSTAKGRGGHCILIIGYSDTEKYWLVKNSWGTQWGDNGFCKIAYGACDIDTETDTVHTYFTSCKGVNIPGSVLGELILNKGLSQLSNIPNSLCCSGFFSADDNMRHSIAGTKDGKVFEIFFNPKTGTGKSLLTNQIPLIDVSSFYTEDDKFRHAITATANGNISEIFYSPKTGIGMAQLGTIPNAIKVGGFFSADDKNRHAIVATSPGKIFEIFYGQRGKGQSQIGTLKNVVDIGCFYSPDDNYRHAIVGTTDGNVTEIFFHPQKGMGSAVLANIPGLTRLSAFYTSKNDFFNRRVQILTQDNNIFELRYNPVHGKVKNLLMNIVNVIDIGGFFSSDDNMAHCILTLTSGDIKELFYNP